MAANTCAAGGVEWYWVVRADRSLVVLHREDGHYVRQRVVRAGERAHFDAPFPVSFDPGTLGY